MQQQLAIAYRPLADLVPYIRNARKHPPGQIAKIKASLVEFGWTNPMLVADHSMIAGHGRLIAALELAAAGIAIPRNRDPSMGPTIDLSALSPAQRRAYVLADNRIAAESTWDDALLKIEMGDLRTEGFDLNLTGFDLGEVGRMFAHTEGRTDPDDVPGTPATPATRPGDVWILGRHRLVCGDSTDAQTVARALAGTKPHLMIADPPYGVEYDAQWRAAKASIKSTGARRAVGAVQNDATADWSAAWSLFPGDVAYVWHSSLKATLVAQSLVACGFEIRSQIIWTKPQLIISRGHYHSQHEPCWYAVREGATGHWAGDRKQSTVWQIDGNKRSKTGHRAQKPTDCMRRPIENNSQPGERVYDPFSGSGTVTIAAEMTGRMCHAIEIDPAHVDLTVRRWEEFTGQQATTEDGRTFAEVSASRG